MEVSTIKIKNTTSNGKKVPREWEKYAYYDPRVVLPKLREIRRNISNTETPIKIRNLRTNILKHEREYWDTAIFCYLMSKVIWRNIYFSRLEKSDYDSVFTWSDEYARYFCPVQMKELVPYEINFKLKFEDIINSLKKYTCSPELIVGIKLNRKGKFDFSKITLPNLPVGEVWCFGAIMPNERKWVLVGDMLGELKQYEYDLNDYV